MTIPIATIVPKNVNQGRKKKHKQKKQLHEKSGIFLPVFFLFVIFQLLIICSFSGDGDGVGQFHKNAKVFIFSWNAATLQTTYIW